jgi:hypothetical protein
MRIVRGIEVAQRGQRGDKEGRRDSKRRYK